MTTKIWDYPIGASSTRKKMDGWEIAFGWIVVLILFGNAVMLALSSAHPH